MTDMKAKAFVDRIGSRLKRNQYLDHLVTKAHHEGMEVNQERITTLEAALREITKITGPQSFIEANKVLLICDRALTQTKDVTPTV